MVDVRREDKTIKEFEIPLQEDVWGVLLKLDSVSVILDHKPVTKKVDISLWKDRHLLLSGPNGIWKSTLLERLASWHAKWETVADWVKIWYYRQDFWNLDFDEIVYDYLFKCAPETMTEQELRSTAAWFLINGDLMKARIWNLSEWQKWLVAFCGLVFQRPGLLILDEPTNHINFRHIPIIAKALDEYKWAMILVSHVDEFVWQIRIDEYLDLDRL
jgi:ATP-binding cassette subfamily F protein 3